MRLSLKAKMERESGKDDEALASYQEMIALGRDIDPKARLDMATFLQLKNDFAGAKKQLLVLWEQHETMPKPLQAEILFWLGEGEHSQKNYDAALDYYLQLAYQYSKESMWPTVAMYRASMIYELKGKYDAARKFLNAVIATAERKEEREAARNRLNALEARPERSSPPPAPPRKWSTPSNHAPGSRTDVHGFPHPAQGTPAQRPDRRALVRRPRHQRHLLPVRAGQHPARVQALGTA
jgi:tetratricopeptide (TPR) repeat protein